MCQDFHPSWWRTVCGPHAMGCLRCNQQSPCRSYRLMPRPLSTRKCRPSDFSANSPAGGQDIRICMQAIPSQDVSDVHGRTNPFAGCIVSHMHQVMCSLFLRRYACRLPRGRVYISRSIYLSIYLSIYIYIYIYIGDICLMRPLKAINICLCDAIATDADKVVSDADIYCFA